MIFIFNTTFLILSYGIYKHILCYFLIMTIRKKSSFIFCLLAFLCCHKIYNESLFYCIIPLRFLSAVWVNWRKCNFYSISGFIFRFVPRSETCLWHTKNNIESTCINIRIATLTVFVLLVVDKPNSYTMSSLTFVHLAFRKFKIWNNTVAHE